MSLIFSSFISPASPSKSSGRSQPFRSSSSTSFEIVIIKRLRIELIRQHGLRLAIDTIHKVLVRNDANRLKRPKLQRKKKWKRYSRPVPGDRVRMDVCKIANGLYQFTAIEDCSRYQVAALFPRKTAKCTLAFLDRVAEQMPFPIQRMQTDRGQEFFACDFQDRLKERRTKFRPTKPRPTNPRSPHLAGKVERVQRTALEEFWPTVELNAPDLSRHLAEWLTFYNRDRPHDSLGGKAPINRLDERRHLIPAPEAIEAAYKKSSEPIRINDYAWDKLFIRSKPSWQITHQMHGAKKRGGFSSAPLH